jgi:glutathione S-transferase
MITLYHMPKTRSQAIMWFLEELGEPYEVRYLDREKGEIKSPDYLAINPMGKVPTVVVDGTVITERPAISAYLADLYPHKGLAPAPVDPARADYLKWLFFSVGCIEPAFMEKFNNWQVDPTMAAWGSYPLVIKTLETGLAGKSYLVGDRFTAADVNIGSMVYFGQLFGLIEGEIFRAYTERLTARPAFLRAAAKDTA